MTLVWTEKYGYDEASKRQLAVQLAPMGELYRRWLVRYGIWLAVQHIERSPESTFTLARLRAEMDDDGLLDGFDRCGDMWLMQVVRTGPFEKPKGELEAYGLPRGYALEDAQEHFAHPGKPPGIHAVVPSSQTTDGLPSPAPRAPHPSEPVAPMKKRRVKA